MARDKRSRSRDRERSRSRGKTKKSARAGTKFVDCDVGSILGVSLPTPELPVQSLAPARPQTFPPFSGATTPFVPAVAVDTTPQHPLPPPPLTPTAPPQQQQQLPAERSGVTNGNSNERSPPAEAAAEAPAAAAAAPTGEVDSRPSPADFVPSIPKSLLPLVLSAGPVVTVGAVVSVGHTASTYMSQELMKITREARRCHISGFNHVVTPQDLMSYFTVLIQDVRRQMLERETGRPVPDNATVDLDRVIDMTMDSAKSKPFGFLELNNPDMVTELIRQCSEDKDRFVYHCSRDGSAHTLQLRRPKDFQCPTKQDRYRIAFQGIPSLISDARVEDVLSSFGELLSFQRNERFVFCEFQNADDAKECVEDLNGQVLSGRVVLAQRLSEPLRGLLLQSGIKMGEARPDAFVVPKDGSGGVDGGGSAELTLYEEPAPVKKRDHVKEVSELITTLNNAVLHLKDSFPHLQPLFGTNIPVFPTRILVLLNMFDEADVVLDEDYSKLLQEISSEVEKYGRVKQLIVPRRLAPPVPPKPLPPKKFERKRREVNVLPLHNPFCGAPPPPAASGSGAAGAGALTVAPLPLSDDADEQYQQFLREKEEEERRFQEEKDAFHRARETWQKQTLHPVHGGVGKVFVEYESVDEAALAQSNIAGKLFHLRTVVTSFLFEDVLYPSADEEETEKAADATVEEYLKRENAGADIEVDRSEPPPTQQPGWNDDAMEVDNID